MKLKIYTSLFAVLISGSVLAQDTINNVLQFAVQEDSKKPTTYPKLKLGGVFQARYLANFKKNVDINGQEYSNGNSVDNSFEIKRMRVSLNAKISENLELSTLVNLADFKNDPKTRVLENAFAKYTVNQYLKIQGGQFRPAFGIEDSHPVDIVKSIDFSNMYYLMGSNGWQSFQIGVSAEGKVNLGKVPFSYSVAITNGNGKNTTDNDNGKHYTSRFSFNFKEANNFQVGLSTGIGEEKKKHVHAMGIDLTYKFKLASKWSLDFQVEGSQATNHILYFSEVAKLGEIEGADLRIKDYMMRGFYVLPNLRYEIGKQRFQALELSMRYEYLDASTKVNSNPRQTLVPMVSLEFLKNYGARIQVGMQIDTFKTNISNTKNYNSNLAFVQFQCRL